MRGWLSRSKARLCRHHVGHMTELGSCRSYRAALNARALGEAITRGEATYKHPANAQGEVILAAKLNAHGEVAHECSTNT